MQLSGIYGAEAPIPLRRDPVTMQSEQRRSDMIVMAESIADAMGGEEKVRKLPVRRMNSFALEALPGFGEYKVPFAAGVGGYQLVDTLQSTAISQRRDLFFFGFRFS